MDMGLVKIIVFVLMCLVVIVLISEANAIGSENEITERPVERTDAVRMGRKND